ncbi:MAG: hypothetical protein GX087_06095 [Desulfobulbaceae bacterium]|nr:hypothetical protein [Desulfobulbaceae bacterium]
MMGLSYLSHAFNTSDGETVWRWLENPYHQHFCGGRVFFCHELAIDPRKVACRVKFGTSLALSVENKKRTYSLWL